MKSAALVVLVFVSVFALSSCGRSPAQIEADNKRAEADNKQAMKYKAAEEQAKKWREEGAKALEEADAAIRNESGERRTRLEKASKQVRTSNRDGVRVDQYILKRGGIISCTTTISGNSPAMFNCDGDV